MSRGFSANRLIKLQVPPKVKEGWPLIIDDNSLAFQLGIRNKTLQYMLRLRNSGDEGLSGKDGKRVKAYECFYNKVYNPDGTIRKERPIQAPNERLKEIHRVLNGIFSSQALAPPVSAYVRGLSIDMAAAQHIRPTAWVPEEASLPDWDNDPRFSKTKRHKIQHDPTSEPGWFYHQPTVQIHLDIKNFFNSIRASWIRKFFFEEVGYSHSVSYTLASLCTVKHGDRRFLPQGSPLSGSLANLVGYHMFGATIQSVLASHSKDWVWTIYSDDIVMSHPEQTITAEEVEEVKQTVIRIIEDSGFKINHEKTTVKSSKTERLTVLGFTVNEQLNLQKSTYLGLKALLHNCKVHGWESQAHRLKVRSGAAVVQYVRGKLQSIRKATPHRYEELDRIFQQALTAYPIKKSTEVVLREVSEVDAPSDGPQASEVPM